MLRFLIALIATLAASTLAVASDDTNSRVEQLRATVGRSLDEAGGQGAGLVVIDGGRVRWVGGVGLADRETGRKIDGDTIFPVASVSKTFIGLALAMLVEEGKLTLDTPLAAVVPEIPIINPWHSVRPITIRDLLEHTSGLQEVIMPWPTPTSYAPNPTHMPAAAFLSHVAPPVTVRWMPGLTTTYSNYNYIAASAVIERLVGRPFDEYIRETIFLPLGMTSSSFRFEDVDRSRLAKGYASKTGEPIVPAESYYRYAAGLWSSPSDLARFLEAVLATGTAEDPRIATAAALREMERPRAWLASRLGLRLGHGPGVVLRQTQGRIVAGHGGAIDGFLASLYYSRELGFGYAILLNAHLFGDVPSRVRLESAIFDIFLSDRLSPVTPLAKVDVDASAWDGFYELLNPRFALTAFGERLRSAFWLRATADGLVRTRLFGSDEKILPMGGRRYRGAHEVDASFVLGRFSDGSRFIGELSDDVYVKGNAFAYLLRLAMLAIAISASVVSLLATFLTLRCWRRDASDRVAALVNVATMALLALTPLMLLTFSSTEVATSLNARTAAIAAASALYPGMALLGLGLAVRAGLRRWNGRRRLAIAGSAAHVFLGIYLAANGFVAVRLWDYPGLY